MRPWFVVHPPRADELPIVVEVPHAGLEVPPHFANGLLAPVRALARDADLFVDELYADVPDHGATLLVAHVSRYVVDLNRAETDLDAEAVVGAPSAPRAPRGVIWRLTTDNERCIASPLTRAELEARLSEVYRPYHAALASVVERKLERFGVCVVLAAHSMPSVAKEGGAKEGGALERADLVPGTQGRTTADPRLIAVVERHATDAGLRVKHDDPYRGGYVTRHWGRPGQGVHAIQVELSRRLYMHEGTLTRASNFAATQDFAVGLVARLGAAGLSLRA